MDVKEEKNKDFYQILGLTKEASPFEIKQAYRKLSLHAHPDHGGSHERMQLLNEAYEKLSDPVKRRAYHAAQNADVDNEASVEISGYLRVGNTPPYSLAFRKEHKILIAKYLSAPLKPISTKEREVPFESNLYHFANTADNTQEVAYPHVFALLQAKRDYSQKQAATIPQKALTPQLAVQLFMDFLAGSYYGVALAKLIDYLSSHITQNKEQAFTTEFYQGIFEIIAMTEKPIEARQALIFSIKKITDFAKEASDNILPSLIPLFYNQYFRNLFAYALTLYWNAQDGLFDTNTLKQFDGSEETKELLQVLKERLLSSNKSEELSELIRHVKLLYLFEKDQHSVDVNVKQAEEYRRSAFHCLDWIPALLEKNSRQIFANVYLQIGIKFQQAARLEGNPVVQMADERLALKMYLTALGVASHSTPDVEIYINTMVIKYLSAFTYQDERLKEILLAIKERTLSRVDVFPFFESPKSNIALFKEDNRTLHLMRRLLNTMVDIYEHNKSHSQEIPLEHTPVTVLYQAYEACLKNWYQKEYNPALENQFRLDLMDELLFDNGWTFLDVEQRITSPWIMVDRNDNGWISPTRALPYPTEGMLFRSINGAELNLYTGSIYFYLMPWSADRPVYEKLFSFDDLQQTLERNIGGAIFSLDPVDPDKPYHPFNQMRFAPNRLLESELLNTMLLTDYILKFLTTGQEVQGYYPFEQRPVNSMIEHLPGYLREIFEEYQAAPNSGALHRFWIEAEELDVYINEQGKDEDRITRIGLDRLKMVVKKHRMTRDIHGELKDSDDEEGWPIYVLTPEQMKQLEEGKSAIEGHAMIFIHAVAKLFYWENNSIVQIHYPSRDYRDILIRLYSQSREWNGKVIVSTKNMPLIYRVTTEMAQQSGRSHRYSPEFIFTHKFTTHYDEFAQYLPEFGRLKELSKISALIGYLSRIRQSNKKSLEVLNYILNPSSSSNTSNSPPNPDIYQEYKEEQESICKNVADSFASWREQFSTLQQKRYEQLKELQRELGELTFYSYSPEVNEACQRLYNEYASNSVQPSWKIWEMINPKKVEIAKQLTDTKRKNCYAQLHELFSSSLPSLNRQTYGELIDSFIKGDIYPLADALTQEDKKKGQTDIHQQHFPRNSMEDITYALNANTAVIKRIGQQESRYQFHQQQEACKKLAAGFVDIHLGEEHEEQEMNLSEECLWVPASVRHEVPKDKTSGLSRHSFFVYGGVNVQPRLNVTQGGNGPLGGYPVGGGLFNRSQATKGFDDHHIASHTNKHTKNHVLFDLAGMSMHSRANKVFLPKGASLHESRSIHSGRHTDSYSRKVAGILDNIVERGKAQGWTTKEQYRAATRQELSNLRQEFRAGNIGLNKNLRKSGTKW